MACSDNAPSRRSRRCARAFAWLGGLALLLVLPLFLSDYRAFQLGLVASTAIIAAGLMIVTGIAGQVSLAQAAFAALGAYGSALLALRLGIAPWLGVPAVGCLAAAAGYALGLLTLRVEGHYLALATMALTAILEVVILNWESLTGGALGLAVAPLTLAGMPLTSGRALYYVAIPVAVAMFLAAANLIDSRIGRAMSALRQSEVAARSLGVGALHYKSLAFAISAFFGAVGGGLQALQATYLDPHQFGILESVLYLAIIVVGGLRSLAGAVLGSAVFTVIPGMLGAFQSWRGFSFAVLLLLTIVAFPGGLASIAGVTAAAVSAWRGRRAR